MDMAQAMPGGIPVKTNGESETYKLRRYAESRKNALQMELEQWKTDCQQVARYVDPARGRWDTENSSQTTAQTPSKRSRKDIINSTATTCVRVAAAGFSSHMTSKSRPWFQVDASEPGLRDQYDVRVWSGEVTDQLRDTLAKSNFYKAIPMAYTEDVMFGIAAMLMPEHPDEIVTFHTLTYGTFAIGLNEFGEVDTLYRWFRKTARQIKQEYGEDVLPDNVKQALTNNKPDTYFTLHALIERNPDEKPGMGPLGLQLPKFRPWREMIWMSAGSAKGIGCLKVNGYYEQPFVAFRFSPVGDDVYSTSPCIDALGDIKQLQYNEGQKLKLGDLMAEPPMGIPEHLRNQPASLAPRSKTYLPASQVGQQAGPLYQPSANAYTVVTTEIRELEGRIRETLFYPLFLMLASLDDRERTATEIAERRDERATVLGPTVESITDEGLDPIILRVFRILERRQMLPPLPEALTNKPLKIEYTSILAQAMKASAVGGIERAFQFVAAQYNATQDPAVLDKWDADQAADEYATRLNIPPKIVRSDDAVQQIRAGRAQQAQMQQMAAMAKPALDATAAYKNLAETVPAEDSAADQIGAVMGA